MLCKHQFFKAVYNILKPASLKFTESISILLISLKFKIMTKRKKILLTILIVVVFFGVYSVYMFLRVNAGKFIPLFTGIIFAIVPAYLISVVWNKKSKEI